MLPLSAMTLVATFAYRMYHSVILVHGWRSELPTLIFAHFMINNDVNQFAVPIAKQCIWTSWHCWVSKTAHCMIWLKLEYNKYMDEAKAQICIIIKMVLQIEKVYYSIQFLLYTTLPDLDLRVNVGKSNTSWKRSSCKLLPSPCLSIHLKKSNSSSTVHARPRCPKYPQSFTNMKAPKSYQESKDCPETCHQG